jgi:hypothetical protein
MSALDNPEKWKQRAEQMRKLAAVEPNPDTMKTMEEIAADYEKLAQRAADRQLSN